MKHHNTNLYNDDIEEQKRKTGKRRVIPKEVIRRMAMQSRDGGRGYCRWCKTSFAMYYLRLARNNVFRDFELACVDCIKEYKLIKDAGK
jgi:hypothetical protein